MVVKFVDLILFDLLDTSAEICEFLLNFFVLGPKLFSYRELRVGFPDFCFDMLKIQFELFGFEFQLIGFFVKVEDLIVVFLFESFYFILHVSIFGK